MIIQNHRIYGKSLLRLQKYYLGVIIKFLALSVPVIFTISGVWALVYGITVGIVSFLDPAWGVYSIFVVCTNYGFTLLGPGVSLIRLVVPIVVISIMGRCFLRWRFPRPDGVWIFIVIFYIYACTITLISGQSDARMLAFMLSSLCIRSLVMHDTMVLKKVLTLYIIAVLTSATIGLIKGGYIVAGSLYRFVGGYTDPNEFAKYLLIALNIVLFSKTIGSKSLKGILTGIFVVLILLTYSKMGILVASVLILLYLIANVYSYRSYRANQRKMAIVAFLIILIIVISICFPWHSVPLTTNIAKRLSIGFNPFSKTHEFLDALTTRRWSLHKASVAAFLNSDFVSKVFGRGYNSSREALQSIIGQLISTHSTFLQIILDFGLLGCTMFILILLLSINWCTADLSTFIRSNSLWFTYVATFTVLAWLFNWSNLPFFAWIDTQSFREINTVEPTELMCREGVSHEY